MKKDVKVIYPAGHTYEWTYELTELFCPHCGSKSVFVEDSDGDFYQGPTHACTKCSTMFTMPSIYEAKGSENMQLIEQLKED